MKIILLIVSAIALCESSNLWYKEKNKLVKK
jgi:hypothetical protein